MEVLCNLNSENTGEKKHRIPHHYYHQHPNHHRHHHHIIAMTMYNCTYTHHDDHHQGGHGARAGVVGGAEKGEVLQLHEEEESCCTTGGGDYIDEEFLKYDQFPFSGNCCSCGGRKRFFARRRKRCREQFVSSEYLTFDECIRFNKHITSSDDCLRSESPGDRCERGWEQRQPREVVEHGKFQQGELLATSTRDLFPPFHLEHRAPAEQQPVLGCLQRSRCHYWCTVYRRGHRKTNCWAP